MAEHTKKLREMQDGLRERFREIKADRTTSAEEKDRRIRQEQERFRENYQRERQNVLDGFQERRQKLNDLAHPPEPEGEDTQAEILKEQRRARIHRELTATWEGRRGGPTVQELERAYADGDELRIEALEIYAPAAIADPDARERFTHRVEQGKAERLTEIQRAALAGLRALEREEYETQISLAQLDNTARELT